MTTEEIKSKISFIKTPLPGDKVNLLGSVIVSAQLDYYSCEEDLYPGALENIKECLRLAILREIYQSREKEIRRGLLDMLLCNPNNHQEMRNLCDTLLKAIFPN